MTTRRGVLLALSGLSAASLAGGQGHRPVDPKRLGILNARAAPDRFDPKQSLVDEGPFWDAMRKKGWILGENVVVERVYANWNPESLAGLAQELVRKRVDVILCDTTEEAQVAAVRASRTIPIVLKLAFIPVELGLIDSYARPGRNVTGTAFSAVAEALAKRLETLREIMPTAKRLSWIWGAGSLSVESVAGGRVPITSMLETAARSLGYETQFHLLRVPQDIDSVFRSIISSGAQVITAGGAPVGAALTRIVELALHHRLPSAFPFRSFAEAGGLLSYGPPASEFEALELRTVEYVDRILRGTRPAELPVEQPSRFELVINMKTAALLGLAIPRALLTRADALIQ